MVSSGPPFSFELPFVVPFALSVVDEGAAKGLGVLKRATVK